jgi:hypothetical protein
MFFANFRMKTFVQETLFNIRNILDFAEMHPAREMARLALNESVAYAAETMKTALGVETARQVLDIALNAASAQGYFMEFGVFKGGTIRYIAAKVGAQTVVHGFDSFHGLPSAWSGNRSMFDTRGKLPRTPGNVQLHEGFFDATLPDWTATHSGPVAFVHIDCDIYASTKTVFSALAPRFVPGTVIVFDEYFNYPGWQNHEFKAFQETVQEHGLTYEYITYARIQVAVRITGTVSSGMSSPTSTAPP